MRAWTLRNRYYPLLIAMTAAGLGSGCDHFRVEDFPGSKLLLQIAGAPATAPGRHLELWARDAVDDQPRSQNLIRLLASDGGRRPDGTPCGERETCAKAAYA